VRHFEGFFKQITVRKPIGRNDSIQTVCRKSRRLEALLYLAEKKFELFTNIQENLKIKNL
jgi:hypothetical protein